MERRAPRRPLRSAARELPALAPAESPSSVFAILLVVLALVVPTAALVLGATPPRVLPERFGMLLDARRETLVALGVAGTFGAAAGIAIGVFGL